MMADEVLAVRRDDYGFFGPDSPSWKVWASPTVPASRDEVRQYFADVRSRLCTSEHADRAMHYLLRTPRDSGVRLWAGSRLLAPAAIATLPQWMRRMGNFDQSAAVDTAVTPIARTWVRALSANNFRPMLAVARRIAPETAEVLAAHLTAGPPAQLRTISPSEARERLAAPRVTTSV